MDSCYPKLGDNIAGLLPMEKSWDKPWISYRQIQADGAMIGAHYFGMDVRRDDVVL